MPTAEGLDEELAELGVDGLGKVVAKEAEDGVDFFFDDLPVELGKACENFDEHGQHGLFGAGSLAAKE